MIKLKSLDERIAYYPLFFERDVTNIPEYPLPEGYSFSFFKPGDAASWIEVEMGAGELSDLQMGQSVWEKYYGPWEHLMPERMIFIVNEKGEKVGTATAFFDVIPEAHPGLGDGSEGWLHWVGITKAYQGRGLARPLIGYTMKRLKALGYQKLLLSTQTTSWVACRLYMEMGWRPRLDYSGTPEMGWRVLKRLLPDQKALESIATAPEKEVFKL